MSAPGDRLRAAIRAHGALPFAAFMEEALYGAEGYYRRAAWPVGGAGDYVTGSTLSPLFAATTARLLARLDPRLGTSAELFEAGYGDGRHLTAVAARAEARGRRLTGWDRAARPLPPGIEAIADLETRGARSVDGIVFSYELFDALPVTRLLGGAGGELGELRVALEATGELVWRPYPTSPAAARAVLAASGVVLAPGQIADVAAAWEPTYRALARRLGRGLLVTCDYGFPARQLYDARIRPAGTLACYRGHRVHRDALRDVGEQDLTAHVDFSLLIRVGEEEGLATVALTRQANWLAACGLFAELEGAPAASRYAALALLDLEGMGEEISVLVQTRDLDTTSLFDVPLLNKADSSRSL